MTRLNLMFVAVVCVKFDSAVEYLSSKRNGADPSNMPPLRIVHRLRCKNFQNVVPTFAWTGRFFARSGIEIRSPNRQKDANIRTWPATRPVSWRCDLQAKTVIGKQCFCCHQRLVYTHHDVSPAVVITSFFHPTIEQNMHFLTTPIFVYELGDVIGPITNQFAVVHGAIPAIGYYVRFLFHQRHEIDNCNFHSQSSSRKAEVDWSPGFDAKS